MCLLLEFSLIQLLWHRLYHIPCFPSCPLVCSACVVPFCLKEHFSLCSVSLHMSLCITGTTVPPVFPYFHPVDWMVKVFGNSNEFLEFSFRIHTYIRYWFSSFYMCAFKKCMHVQIGRPPALPMCHFCLGIRSSIIKNTYSLNNGFLNITLHKMLGRVKAIQSAKLFYQFELWEGNALWGKADTGKDF